MPNNFDCSCKTSDGINPLFRVSKLDDRGPERGVIDVVSIIAVEVPLLVVEVGIKLGINYHEFLSLSKVVLPLVADEHLDDAHNNHIRFLHMMNVQIQDNHKSPQTPIS